MADSILTTLASERYAKAADDEDRSWVLLLELCDALHPLGPIVVPHRSRVVELAHRLERDEEIRREFDGRNYEALAERHGLTTRRVRDIIGTRGWRPRK